jgi:CO/xanthine dehydrogenase Mo-binding subunit
MTVGEVFLAKFGSLGTTLAAEAVCQPTAAHMDPETGQSEKCTEYWFPSATAAEVEVDTETGHVRVTKMCHVQDCGLPLNRKALESQINGGMIQSMGMALYEGRVMDAELGVMVNADFGDYKLPGTMEMPELIPIIDDGDVRQVVIGMAEGANVPGVGAVANAVYNACGVRVRQLPITPDKILNGLMQMQRG